MSRPFRRLAFGFATLLGAKPLGFFIPYRHAGAARPCGYKALEQSFLDARASFEAVLDAIEGHAAELGRILAGEGPARDRKSVV